MHRLVDSYRFALLELTLILLCGAVWIIRPDWGGWFILIALLPLFLRLTFSTFIFTPFDWIVLVFIISAWAGYWAAYDHITAWNKAWMIMTAGLLYITLREQPKHNLPFVSFFLFFLGVGISVYFLLTHDFVSLPRKLELVNQFGRWLMSIRPQTEWEPVHPNYVAGIIAITEPFIIFPAWVFKKNSTHFPNYLLLAVLIGLGISVLALLMTTSRGVVFAIVSGVGGWLLWRALNLTRIQRRIVLDSTFPILILIYLCLVVAFLFSGPAQTGDVISGYYFGNGSRAELFSRSLYLLIDYPITGGGLGSFPGLYSQYLLGIPFINVPNSHNLFLDVGIEQGLFGGVAFLVLYIGGIWVVSSSLAKDKENQTFKRIVLFSLIVAFVHGMLDNYLYNGVGTLLSIFLIGLSMNVWQSNYSKTVGIKLDLRRVVFAIAIFAFFFLQNIHGYLAVWYANLGAVQLEKLELRGFPNKGWIGYGITSEFEAADASLHKSLYLDRTNPTANHRLGLIAMYRKEFFSAAHYLEIAHEQLPDHRGITKALGYCYVWLGDIDKSQEYLEQIPEAVDELDVYSWWWKTQGRSDLSDNAALALDALTAISQP